jgi:hypothetical protein
MQVSAALAFYFLKATYVGVAQNASKCGGHFCHNTRHKNDEHMLNNNTWPMR